MLLSTKLRGVCDDRTPETDVNVTLSLLNIDGSNYEQEYLLPVFEK